jgi:hypothetical protein
VDAETVKAWLNAVPPPVSPEREMRRYAGSLLALRTQNSPVWVLCGTMSAALANSEPE